MASRKRRNRRKIAKTHAPVTPQQNKLTQPTSQPMCSTVANTVQPTTPTASSTVPNSRCSRFSLPTLTSWSATGVLAGLLLCALIGVSYFPAMWAGLVWDDAILNMAEPIHRLSGLWDIWFVPNSLGQYEGHYWPLLYTTFWLDHKLWGGSTLAYHLVNVVLHAAVTLLLWRLLLRFGVAGAWFAAAIFAVHPMHVESVVWVIGRKDLLATLLYLATVWCYVSFVEKGRRRWYAVAVLFFVASLLSKSVAVTLPVSLLLWHWWKSGQVTLQDALRVMPFLLIGLGVATVDTWWIYKEREILTFDYSFLERVLIAARALWFYAWKLFWPLELAGIYQRWQVGLDDYIAWMCLLGSVAVVAYLWFMRHRIGAGWLFGGLFFAVTLSPTLSFVDYGYMQFSFVADRYQYLAGAALLVMFAAALAIAARRLPGAKRFGMRVMGATFGLALCAGLGYLTWQQANIYQHNGTFFAHVLSLNPQARSAQYNFGDWLQKQGRFDEALAAYRVALQQQPEFADIHNNIGVTLQKIGRSKAAEESYRRALSLKPRFTHAQNNLALLLTKQALLLTKQQQYNEALELYRSALQIDPAYVNINTYIGMGVVLSALSRYQEALQSFERALILNPASKEAQQNRDSILQIIRHRTQ